MDPGPPFLSLEALLLWWIHSVEELIRPITFALALLSEPSYLGLCCVFGFVISSLCTAVSLLFSEYVRCVQLSRATHSVWTLTQCFHFFLQNHSLYIKTVSSKHCKSPVRIRIARPSIQAQTDPFRTSESILRWQLGVIEHLHTATVRFWIE